MFSLKRFILYLVWGFCSTYAFNKIERGLLKLKAVSFITRHGDRSPVMSYPLDPHKDYPWPGGFGALTPEGAKQLGKSGRIKAQRYSELLQSDNQRPVLERIYVQSTSAQRCRDSAMHFLDTFLPVRAPKDLVYVPVEDEIMGATKPCPNLEMELVEGFTLNNSEVKKIIDIQTEHGSSIIAFLEKNSGLNITHSSKLLLLADTLFVERTHQLVLPPWADYTYRNYLQPLISPSIAFFGESRYMEIRSGGLLRDMISRMDDYLQKRSPQNILFYSGHDTNLCGLLHILEVLDQYSDRPAYASVISIELYENPKLRHDFEVKLIYYKKYDDIDPVDIEIPGCPAPCPYKKFKKLVRPKLIFNYEQACRV